MKKMNSWLLSRGLATAALFGSGVGLVMGFSALSPEPELEATPTETVKVVLPIIHTSALAEVESTIPESCQLTIRTTVDARAADGVSLTLHLLDDDGTESIWNAVTNDGVHRFTDLPRGAYHLTATLDERAMKTAPTLHCGGDESRSFHEIDLSDAGTPVSLTLNAGKMLTDADVMIAQEAGAKTSLTGVAHLPRQSCGNTFDGHLAPGRYTALVKARGFEDERFEIIVKDRPLTVERRLKWRPVANGQVVDEVGNPIAGALLYLGPRIDPNTPLVKVHADDDGRFSVPITGRAGHTLTAHTPKGIATVRLGKPQTVVGHEDLALQVAPGRTVQGHVMTQRGSAHAYGKVRFRVKSLGIEGVLKADGEGNFTIPHAPRDDVELWADDSAIGAFGGRVSSLDAPRVLLQYVDPAYAKR